MLNLYIIAGCNGAGKTTASFTILPEVLNCREFVNADTIAAELSPLNPESVAIEAGRIMLKRVSELMDERADFAFETTLATRSYVSLIKKAHDFEYKVTLLYFWLDSPETAYDRVAKRVKEGGHNIPIDVIERRYHNGLRNFFNLYQPVCDTWIITNNTTVPSQMIARGDYGLENKILNSDIWEALKNQYDDNIG